MPDDVGTDDFALPFYACVVGMEGDTVQFQSLEGEEGELSRSIAARRKVTTAAVNKMGRVSLLRRPVSVTTEDPEPKVIHGQVVDVGDGTVTVETDGTQLVSRVDKAKVVTPIVTLLLRHVVFDMSEWSSADVNCLHTTIVSRVLDKCEDDGSDPFSPYLAS
ncbi:hypothetical protein ON010_g17444 [Phytophthora cinnamomi]|nr:hypothetical protein ON010_g17444 [Phytophthora cinnamomi]